MRIGVDIGGMSVKIGVVDHKKIIDRRNFSIEQDLTDVDIVSSIVDRCNELAGIYDIRSIGIGTPGIIKNDKVSASNLPFSGFALRRAIAERVNLPVVVENDGACAVLGEQVAGAGVGAGNILLVTLGTGIGVGIIINGEIYSGCGSAGEAGHMCIDFNGLECSCGSRGCWEQYASVSALKRQTMEAARANPGSMLAKMCADGVTGKTVFSAAEQGCEVAKDVIDRYIDYLSVGLSNLIKIFDPETVLISGGLSNEGENLLDLLKTRLMPFKDIKLAALRNDAGIIGAAVLSAEN